MYRQAIGRMMLLGFAFASILSLGGCSLFGGDGPGTVTGVEDSGEDPRPTTPTGLQHIEVYASHDNTVTMNPWKSLVANTVYRSGLNMVGCIYITGFFQGTHSLTLTALKFDVQQEIAGRSINRATLRLHFWGSSAGVRSDMGMHLSAIGQDWDPATLTYNTMPQLVTGTDMKTPFPTTDVLDIDVSMIVSDWASGAFGNYGFMLMDRCVATPLPGAPLSQMMYFESLEVSSLTTGRPLLIIEFN
jgi:hypothetical protein